MGDQATSIPAEEMTVQVQQMAAALQAVQAELAGTHKRLSMEKVNAKNFKQRGRPSSTGSVPSFQY
jgi:hypothetical protein